MTRKLFLALAAAATLAVGAFASANDANAFRGGMGRAHVGGGGMRHMGGMRHIGGMRHVGLRAHFRPHLRHHVHLHGHGGCWRFPWRCRVGVYARYAVPAVVAAAPVAYGVSTSRCTCLTKEYLQDGSGVLFKDTCTKEEAFMPNPNQQQTAIPNTQPQTAYQPQAASPYQPQAAYQPQMNPYQSNPYQTR